MISVVVPTLNHVGKVASHLKSLNNITPNFYGSLKNFEF